MDKDKHEHVGDPQDIARRVNEVRKNRNKRKNGGKKSYRGRA